MNKVFKYVPITDLLETIIDNRGKTVPTSEKGIPLIATNCIKHSSIYPTLEKVRYVNEETHTNWFRAHLEPNDILFVNKGTPGRVCLVPDPVSFCAAQDMMAFRCNDDLIDYKYLFAVLRSDEIQKKIENNHVGLVIPHLRKQDLSSILIPIRDRKEQELIGNFYVSLSEKIELNNKINAELEAMAKTLYDYWFVQFDFPDANGKPYKTSGGKMVWNEELKRDIPEGWEVGILSDIANITTGKLDSNAEVPDGKYPFYTCASVPTKTDSFAFDDTVILIAGNNAAGNFHINRYKGKFNAYQRTYITTAKNIIDLEYLYQVLKTETKLLKSQGKGSQTKFLTIGMLTGIKIFKGNSTTMNSFNNLVNPMFEQQVIIRNQNQELASLRNWLLPMLMNGQVTVAHGEEMVEEQLGMVAENGVEYNKNIN